MNAEKYFELKKLNGVLRWVNAEEFIMNPCLPAKHSGVLLAFLTFNASGAAIDLLKKIRCDNQSVDILIVDNSSFSEHFSILQNEIKLYENVYLIQTTCNLGGAGGYSLINEIFLRSSYNYLLLTEDDAIPVEHDLVTTIVNAKDKSDMIACHYYNNKSRSFSFHFTMYSRRLVERSGVPDPRFFQGGDDAEIGERHQSVLKSFGQTVFVVNRGYYHPNLKGMGTPAKVIRSMRNTILADLANNRYVSFVTRVFFLFVYSELNLFFGRFQAFRVGFFSFLLIDKMRNPGCFLFSKKEIHESLDKALVFKKIAVNKLYGNAANLHLSVLLNLPVANLFSSCVVIETLDSPWFIKYLLFAKKIFVVNNLSFDMQSVTIADLSPSFLIRLFLVLAIVGGIIFLPIILSLYYYYFLKSFNHLKYN